jgi:hypothetical protein
MTKDRKMLKYNFTPGPWKYYGETTTSFGSYKRNEKGDIEADQTVGWLNTTMNKQDSSTRWQRNMALICAAPEMIVQLQYLVDTFQCKCIHKPCDIHCQGHEVAEAQELLNKIKNGDTW